VVPTFFDDVKGESESLGGLILELHGSLPKISDQIKFENITFTILTVDQRKINRVKVTISPVTNEDE
jgi:CBS domain containing-hemolysin-like protein